MDQATAGVKRGRSVSPDGHVGDQFAFRPKKVKLAAEDENEGAGVEYAASVASELDQGGFEAGFVDDLHLLCPEIFPLEIPFQVYSPFPSNDLPPSLLPPIWFSPTTPAADELGDFEPEKKAPHNLPNRSLPFSVDLESVNIPGDITSFVDPTIDQSPLISNADIDFFSSTSAQYLPDFHEHFPFFNMVPRVDDILVQFSDPNDYVVTQNLNPPGPVTGSIIPLRPRTKPASQKQASDMGQPSHARTQSVPSTQGTASQRQGYGQMQPGYGHHHTVSSPAAVASSNLQNVQMSRIPQMQMPPRSSTGKHGLASGVQPLMPSQTSSYRRLNSQSALAEPPSPLDHPWSQQLSALPQTFAPPSQRANRPQYVATPQASSPLASPMQGVVRNNDLRSPVIPSNISGQTDIANGSISEPMVPRPQLGSSNLNMTPSVVSGHGRMVSQPYNTPPATVPRKMRPLSGAAAQMQGLDWVALDHEARRRARPSASETSTSNPVDLTSPTLETRKPSQVVQRQARKTPVQPSAVNSRQLVARQPAKPFPVPRVEPLELSDKEKDFVFFLHLHDVDAVKIRDQFTYKPFKRSDIKTEQIKKFIEADPHLRYPGSSADDFNNVVRECALRLVNNGRRGRWHYNVNSVKTGRRVTKKHLKWLQEAKGELVGEWNDPELQETEAGKAYWRQKTFEDHDWQNERAILEEKLEILWKGKGGNK